MTYLVGLLSPLGPLPPLDPLPLDPLPLRTIPENFGNLANSFKVLVSLKPRAVVNFSSNLSSISFSRSTKLSPANKAAS